MADLTIDATPAQQAASARGLAFGLPNRWYPVLRSEELGAAPVPIRRFGEQLVVWRAASGVSVIEDACPHRGAPLSRGRIDGDAIACAYHGWRFDPSGACRSMPLEPTPNPRLERVRIRAWRAEERAGYIWMFYGEAARATPLVIPSELEDPARLHFKNEYYWRTNWVNVLDNVLDPLHAIYLHAGATTQKKRAKFKHFEITHDDATGFRLGKVGYRADGSVGAVEGEVEFLLPNVTRLSIADGTEEGIYRVVILSTPIDDRNTCAYYVRSRKGFGMKRLKWRLWWALHRRAVHAVAAQDGEVLDGIAPVEEARARENLVSSDIGVVRLRRRLEREYAATQTGI